MSIRPLHDRLLVKRLEEETKTSSGIIIPDSAKEKPTKGKVVAIGHGYRNEETGKFTPLDVKVGDVILFAKWGGTEVKYNGEELLILKESDVLAVVDEKK
ncbi:MAG: co-chaperone GroES [Alphaproteobacteria bacterium]|jgi:chaperonin GroES